MRNADLFRHEADFPGLDMDLAAVHLSNAVKCPTVSYVDVSKVDYGAFDRLQDLLRAAFPRVAEVAEWERFGHSLLIRLPGCDDTLQPALFMAHQDVVPVIPGTEDDWLHGPFSGDISGGYIWGRGTMDIKQMLIAEMESLEYLLKTGCRFQRTVYLAFAEDEETVSCGARAIAAQLMERGVRFEFVLDEGAGSVSDAADWGAPGELICPIGMYEKGYGDMRLAVRSRGGHSSDPFHGTSLGCLCRAVAAVLNDPPAPRLSKSVLSTLEALAPRITLEPMRTWAKAPEKHEAELLDWFMARESLYHLVSTTVAPTMITPGAPAGNVMPQDMEAVINFRMIPEDTPEKLLDRYRALLGADVDVSWVQRIGASVPSEIDSYGYRALKSTLERYFDRLIFIPAQNRGATDARNYEGLSRCVMRFGPFLEEEDVSAEGVHGTNERISLRAFYQGIRVLTRLMEDTCVKGERF